MRCSECGAEKPDPDPAVAAVLALWRSDDEPWAESQESHAAAVVAAVRAADNPPRPLCEGVVTDAGGGSVSVLVARSTEDYPRVGTPVAVVEVPDSAKGVVG